MTKDDRLSEYGAEAIDEYVSEFEFQAEVLYQICKLIGVALEDVSREYAEIRDIHLEIDPINVARAIIEIIENKKETDNNGH